MSAVRELPEAESLPPVTIDVTGLQALFDHLADEGYRVLGPTKRDDAIVYDDIDKTSDLPQGWTDEQAPGSYRLKRRGDAALFGYVVGPHSWKRFLHPPRERLWRSETDETGTRVIAEPPPEERFAFIGVRACELAAIAIQDRVFFGGQYVDQRYKVRRENAFLVAVNCSEPGGTCFCTSMNTGPRTHSGFDIALTELLDDRGHRFLVEAGSAAGKAAIDTIQHADASGADVAGADALLLRAAAAMGRSLPAEETPALLKRNLEHPRWKEVAERCLACANCTMVCPTCFCTSVEDSSALDGSSSERAQRWDSCFTMDYSYVHGGSVRRSNKSRYRQWMTHKLSTWKDQFDTSGCVGCGRCIAWCPVGIDITEEVAAIRADDQRKE